MCGLLWCLAKFGIKPETKEHQDSADPLHGVEDVAEQKDRAQDGKELPCGSDDGAGERAEVHHSHEDEGLA